MSKKSGFFYAMFGMITGLFIPTYQHRSTTQYQPEDKVHRSEGGREITSYGRKPSYYKDKALYQNWGNRIYVSVGHVYWATRALAEANR